MKELLNYANLNDMEFEELCKDVMSKKLNVQLRIFGKGRDGGIDLTDDTQTNNIVVQVKHYVESSTTQLVSNIKKELDKVNKLKPNQYYICCSKELTANNIKEIYKTFSKYMESDKNIVTIKEIQDFLVEEENIDILKKHYKLWISPTTILKDMHTQHISIDSKVLLKDIEKKIKYFVPTKAYTEALKYLENNKTIFLTGEPGVGKTITSEMLTLHFAKLGYRIRYTTSVTDISGLKKSLTDNTDVKEVVLLDDCFGQAYFEMKQTQTTELVSLIKYIDALSNKKLILNSRVTIYQEALQSSSELVESFYNGCLKLSVIYMNKISIIDKAKILYNHLFFNEINKEYLKELIKYKNYYKIIKHKNYNPRIIEFISKKINLKDIQAVEYFEFIMEKLNNPNAIWENEYTKNLETVDRILLTTIYSLTNTIMDYEYIKKIFEIRIKTMNTIDKTLNNFEESLLRLQDSFIQIIDNDNEKTLGMINPSINDYLDNRRKSSNIEYDEIINNSVSVYQLKRLLQEDEFEAKINSLFENENILNFIFKDNFERNIYIVYYVSKNNIKNKVYKEFVIEFLEKFKCDFYYTREYHNDKYSILLNLLKFEIYEFYELNNFFDNWSNTLNIVWKLDVFEQIEFWSKIYEFIEKDDDKVESITKMIFDEIESYCGDVDYWEYENESLLAQYVQDQTYDANYINAFHTGAVVEMLDEEIKNQVRERFDEVLSLLPNDFDKSKFNEAMKYIMVHGIDNAVENFLEIDYDDYADYHYEEYRMEQMDSSYENEIEIIFDRFK